METHTKLAKRIFALPSLKGKVTNGDFLKAEQMIGEALNAHAALIAACKAAVIFAAWFGSDAGDEVAKECRAALALAEGVKP